MAWLGNFTVSDFAGAVTKLSESVKNIEKNFDSALGFESSESGSRDGRPSGERAASVFESLLPPSILAKATSESIVGPPAVTDSGDSKPEAAQSSSVVVTPEVSEKSGKEGSSSVETDTEVSSMDVQTDEHETQPSTMSAEAVISLEESSRENVRENGAEMEEQSGRDGIVHKDGLPDAQAEERASDQLSTAPEPTEVERNENHVNGVHDEVKSETIEDAVVESSKDVTTSDSGSPISASLSEKIHGIDTAEIEPKPVFESQPFLLDTSARGGDKVEKELKMMEAALLGAARQSQAKADEISRLMMENEQLKASLEDLKRKTNEAESDIMREEYQQRISAAERKVYALTKEKDMLRREQNRKSDSSMLLKEKDEIIKAVMAEGEELSKKQAVIEGNIKKLRAQVRELEEEKGRLTTRLQVVLLFRRLSAQNEVMGGDPGGNQAEGSTLPEGNDPAQRSHSLAASNSTRSGTLLQQRMKDAFNVAKR